MKSTLLQIVTFSLLLAGSTAANAQCSINPSSIYSFTYNSTTYELVRENKTWSDAAGCAVSRGGYLAEINDQAEQDAIYNEIMTNGGVTASNTVAPDGGNASYVWIGGNDLGVEGEWVWDGANTGTGTQFWQGTSSGNPVGGLFNNWGNEPDDWNGQDGLGLAITDWPLGVSGQWNDVDDANNLYFVIEIPNTSGLLNPSEDNSNGLAVYPNPVQNQLLINDATYGASFSELTVIDMYGKIVKTINPKSESSAVLDVAELNSGVYFISVLYANGSVAQEKFIK